MRDIGASRIKKFVTEKSNWRGNPAKDKTAKFFLEPTNLFCETLIKGKAIALEGAKRKIAPYWKEKK